jgi:hypothetical protein
MSAGRPARTPLLMRLAPAIVLAALARAAAAQGTAASTTAGLSERLDARTAATVQAIVDSAAANGIPTNPLVAKALEGAAKHASGERIAQAVRSLAGDLAVVSGVLGRDSDEGTLSAAVGALRAGTSPADLRALHAARPGAALAWPLTILANLVSLGVPADTAAGIVLELARAGAADAAYTAFERQVRHDISAGVPPGAAAVARAPADAGRGATPGAGAAPASPAFGSPPATPPRSPAAPRGAGGAPGRPEHP